MISALMLACALHPHYCTSSTVRLFAEAVDAEVTDEQLRSILIVMAHHESGITPDPAPQSWDAHAHVSCGYLQQRCSRIRNRSVREQVRMWLHDVQAGGLAGICGTGPAAARLASRRASEAERLMRAAR